jgi:hypothetical protein
LSKADVSNEIISRMTQLFPFSVGEIEGAGTVPLPLSSGNNIGAVAGVAGKSKGSLGMLPSTGGKPFPGAVGAGKGSAGVTGSLGKAKAGTQLLPGVALAPTSSIKQFCLGKSIIGTTAVLPGMVAFAGPIGLLPSITAVTAGFGAGILMPLALVGVIMAVTSQEKGEAKKSKPPQQPIGGIGQSSSQGFQKPKAEKVNYPFTYAAYGASFQTAPSLSDEPVQTPPKKPVAETVMPTGNSSAGARISRPAGFDRRFSLRIKVPPEAMFVQGILTNGQLFKAFARDVSMHGVRFSAPEGQVHSILQLVFPKKKTWLEVSEQQMHRQTTVDAVAIITSFTNGPDARMKWIELITRLDQEV